MEGFNASSRNESRYHNQGNLNNIMARHRAYAYDARACGLRERIPVIKEEQLA